MPEALVERISQHLLERAVGPVTIGGFPLFDGLPTEHQCRRGL